MTFLVWNSNVFLENFQISDEKRYEILKIDH